MRCCTFRASAFMLQTVLWRGGGRDKSQLVGVFFFFHKADPCLQPPRHVSPSRPHFPVSSGQPNSQVLQPSKGTLNEAVSKWAAAFSRSSADAKLVALALRLFAHLLMEQPHAGAARLSLTSIKANKTWAQAVRLWNMHSLDIRVASPSALCNINRSAIGARIVVDCTQGVVNRLWFVAGRWKKERREEEYSIEDRRTHKGWAEDQWWTA